MHGTSETSAYAAQALVCAAHARVYALFRGKSRIPCGLSTRPVSMGEGERSRPQSRAFERRARPAAPPQHHEQRDEGQQRQDENAAFRSGGAAAPQHRPKRMLAEQMALDQDAAVSRAVEVGLAPVPGGVKTHRPPQRAGVPEAEAEDKAHRSRREEAHRRLAGVEPVEGPEGYADQQRAPPKANPARERVLHIAAEE